MTDQAIGVVDIGGSGGRVSTLTRRRGGFELETIHLFNHPAHQLFLVDRQGGATRRRYWNPLMIYEGIAEGIARIATDSGKELVSMGADGWGSDGCWVSRPGEMLFPSVIAYDDRWREAKQEVDRILPGKERFRLTGTYPDDFLVVNQLYWFQTRQREVIDRADCYLPLPSLYHYWLSGERAVEITWATTGHLASCLTRSYCEPVFSALGLPRDKMPPLRETGGVLGESPRLLADHFGTRPFKVMTPPNHDTACAYAMMPTKTDRPALIISAGTWWCMGANLPEPLVTDAVFNAGFSNVGGVEGAVLNVINMGSFPAQHVRREWERGDRADMAWERFNRLALEGDRPGMTFDIDDKRLRDPARMEKTVLEVAGLDPGGLSRPRATVAALIYRGLAGKAARLASLLGELTGKPTEEIVVIGGGARNDLLNQWIADASGLPVRSGPPDATTLGNALVQACSLGWFGSLAEGREALKGLWEEKIFEPRPRS